MHTRTHTHPQTKFKRIHTGTRTCNVISSISSSSSSSRSAALAAAAEASMLHDVIILVPFFIFFFVKIIKTFKQCYFPYLFPLEGNFDIDAGDGVCVGDHLYPQIQFKSTKILTTIVRTKIVPTSKHFQKMSKPILKMSIYSLYIYIASIYI